MKGIDPTARIAFVQTGDFREAAERLASGLGETYDAQRYSMVFVENLASRTALTAVICVAAAVPHAERLPSGVESIGLKPIWTGQRNPRKAYRPVIEQLERLRPTHVVARFPSFEILRWCLDRDVKVFPSLADSFAPRAGLRGWIDRLRLARLGNLLNDARISCVSNHNIAASEALSAIGVDAAKIVPWDWPRSPTPEDYLPKALATARPFRLICVGTVSAAKGVEDAIHALADNTTLRKAAVLEVVGTGDIEAMRSLAVSLGIADRVEFTGLIPHAEVTPRMHAADVVLIYSRHSYGEGLPGTIYLGFASRTPLIISDHPMFISYFQDGVDALVVPERDPSRLAAAILRLLSDADLYEQLSLNGAKAFGRICHPVLWADTVECWLRDSPQDQAWLAENALARWQTKTSG